MKAPSDKWEQSWREQLADYEAPPEPGDWAAMRGLLDGGSAAPPDSTGGAAGGTGLTGWTGGFWAGLSLAILLLAVAAWLLSPRSTAAPSVSGPSSTTQLTALTPDETLAVIAGPLNKEETDADAADESIPSPGSEPLPAAVRSPSSSDGRVAIGMGEIKAIHDRPAPPAVSTDLAPAPAPSLPALAPKRTHPRVVHPIHDWPATEFPLSATRQRKLLRQQGLQRLGPVVPAAPSNGYFPPVRH